MIRPGEEWGEPTDAAPDLTVRGDDAALAAAVPASGADVPLVRFEPVGSDLARAVGVAPAGAGTTRGIALPMDAIDTDAGPAVNLVVVGVAPPALRAWHRAQPVTVQVDGRTLHEGPATTVVIANGQFLGTADVVPRGHPGDGRLEVQVYALAPTARRAMRGRLATGTHLPHPGIVTTSGRTVVVTAPTARPVTLDGRSVGSRRDLTATVRHPALRLLI